MSDEEKPLELRDKIALEVLNALIIGDPAYHRTKDPSSFGSAYDHTGTAHDLVENLHSKYPKSKEDAAHHMERLARTAYKMADVIRKVRLEVFT